MKEIEGLTFIVDPPELTVPILRPVLDYWDRKRGTRAMPRRLDIEPLELKAFLRHLFLIEPLAGGEFRYRLLGSEITERYGRNSTGKTVREAYAKHPAVAEWITGLLLAAVTRKRPILASGPLRFMRKEHVFSQSLVLPLSDEGDAVTMIFGASRYSVPALTGGASPDVP
jgi:hypothetical protein